MSAAALIEQLEVQGVSLWVEGDALHFDGKASVMTAGVIDQLKFFKPEIIEILTHQQQNTLSEEVLPYEWSVALNLIDVRRLEQHTCDNGVNKSEWLKRLRYTLNLTGWQVNELKATLNSKGYIIYNHMNTLVERTIPAYEQAVKVFFDWAYDNGTLRQYQKFPTGLVNNGCIRQLPADTPEGLYKIMGKPYPPSANEEDNRPEWLRPFDEH